MEVGVEMQRLNGWQRIGVVWSGLWIFGAFVDFFMSFGYYMRNPFEIFDAHYPVVFGIGFYWAVYFLIIWVKDGFNSGA